MLTDRATSILGLPQSHVSTDNDSIFAFDDFLPIDINVINIDDLLLHED
jgi:hypothetical protein